MMEKIILALDLSNKEKIYELIEKTEHLIEVYKVGFVPYLTCGNEIIEVLKRKNKKIFLDLKFFDIPNTVKNAVRIIYENEIEMYTVHLMAGKKVIEEIVEMKEKLKSRTKIIGVSVLTSFNEEDLKFLSINLDIKDFTERLVENGYKLGIDGVVCSGQEIESLRKKYIKPFIIIAPGIRLEKIKEDDQKRVITPKEAIKKGADYIVVGRPVYENPKPEKMILELKKEIENGK